MHWFRSWAPVQYGAALLFVLAALAVSLALHTTLGKTALFVFFAAVVLASRVGGWRPGLLALVASAAAIDFFFMPPIHSLGLGPDDAIVLIIFVLLALLVSYLDAARRNAEGQREESLRQLQDALARIEQLRRLLPSCGECKQVVDDRRYWEQLEAHVKKTRTEWLCPECLARLYPDRGGHVG